MNRVYPREEFCVACRLCEVFCQVEHSQSRDLLRAFKEEQPGPVRRIFVQQEGSVSFAINCRHCQEPFCTYACVSGALTRGPETGFVDFQADKCIGCWTCIVACPYGVITRDPGRGTIAKCDLCPGREIPACIAACPNRALVFAQEEDRVQVSDHR